MGLHAGVRMDPPFVPSSRKNVTRSSAFSRDPLILIEDPHSKKNSNASALDCTRPCYSRKKVRKRKKCGNPNHGKNADHPPMIGPKSIICAPILMRLMNEI
jgi:hypothetical protein